MKSKTQKTNFSRPRMLLIAGVVFLIAAGVYWTKFRSHPLSRGLEVEWVENNFPEKPDEDQIIPFGYTLGQWPAQFLGEPIVMKMAYQKGPPSKFIESITQLWKPVEIELTIRGPRTIAPKLSALDWKACVASAFTCRDEKKQIYDYVFSGSSPKSTNKTEPKITWFDSLDPLGVRGIHFQVDAETYFLDHYLVITEKGAAQDFVLKHVKTVAGDAGLALFLKTLGGLKVKDDLASARAWIQTRIQAVKLADARALPDLRARLSKLIQIQNWIFSLLSTDPTHLEPFFHLAGVTHILTIELMKAKGHTYESQEAWILNSKPLLESLIRYAKDFDHHDEAVSNMESLLQDILLMQQKMSN